MPKKRNKSIFEETHNFKNGKNANQAKSAMLTNTAVLYYSLAICFKRYLEHLAKISPISYKAQAPKIRVVMSTFYSNAKQFAEAKND